MNAVNGTKFTASFPVFSGNFKSAKFDHMATVSGVVTIQDCYSHDNFKHWIYFIVTKSDSPDYVVGKQYKKQGKNFYGKITKCEYPSDYCLQAGAKDSYKTAIGISNGK